MIQLAEGKSRFIHPPQSISPDKNDNLDKAQMDSPHTEYKTNVYSASGGKLGRRQ
jgi:hypothetical protein